MDISLEMIFFPLPNSSFLSFAAILKESDGRKHLEENIVRLRKDQKGLL